MDTTSDQGRIAAVDWKFLGLFTLYLALLIGLVQVPGSLDEAASTFTAASVAAVWSLFSIPVSSIGAQVTFYDFTMEVIPECTGLHYVAIFSAAVLAFRGRSVSSKALGLFAGIGMIFLLNLVRLGMLGVIGHYFADLFSFIHLYLWHALFTIAVLLLWILWINGKINFRWLTAGQVPIVIAAASVTFGLMYILIGYYYAVLAFLADNLFPLLGALMTAPDTVIAEGKYIGYVSNGYVYYSTTGLYTLNFAVFAALAAAAALRTKDRSRFLQRAAAGVGLMVCFHLGMLLMDWSLELTATDRMSSVLNWGIVLISMIAPLVSWASAVLMLRSRTVTKAEEPNDTSQ